MITPGPSMPGIMTIPWIHQLGRAVVCCALALTVRAAVAHVPAAVRHEVTSARWASTGWAKAFAAHFNPPYGNCPGAKSAAG